METSFIFRTTTFQSTPLKISSGCICIV